MEHLQPSKQSYMQFILMLIFVGTLLILSQSCLKESTLVTSLDTLKINSSLGVGQMIISMANPDLTDTIPSSCIVTIQNKKGQVIFQDKNLKLNYQNTNSYISLPLNLNSGYYELTACQILDSLNTVLFQEKIQSVPIGFKIENDKSLLLVPSLAKVNQVLALDSFFLYAYYLDGLSHNYINTSASVTLSNNQNVFYTGNLTPQVNSIFIPHGIDYLIITITKPLYQAYHDSITISNLSLYKRIYPYSAFLFK